MSINLSLIIVHVNEWHTTENGLARWRQSVLMSFGLAVTLFYLRPMYKSSAELLSIRTCTEPANVPNRLLPAVFLAVNNYSYF